MSRGLLVPMRCCTNPVLPNFRLEIGPYLFNLLPTGLLLLARRRSQVMGSKIQGKQINQKVAVVIIQESDDNLNEGKKRRQNRYEELKQGERGRDNLVLGIWTLGLSMGCKMDMTNK